MSAETTIATTITAGIGTMGQLSSPLSPLVDAASDGFGWAQVMEHDLGESEVILYGKKLGHEGAQRLAKLLQQPECMAETLDLGYTGLGANGAIEVAMALAKGAGAPVKVLDMGDNGIGDAGASAIGTALASHASRLSSLELYCNDIGDDGALALAEGLCVRSNVGGDDDVMKKKDGGSGKKTIDGQGEPSRDGDSAKKAAAVERHSSTTTNTTTTTTITATTGSDSAAAAAAAAATTVTATSTITLLELDLSLNRLGPASCTALANVIRLKHLQQLLLRGNRLGPQGASALASALRHGGGSSSGGGGAIVGYISLKILNVARCQLGDQGVCALASALETNRSLIHLNVSVNGVTEEGAARLSAALLRRHPARLEYLHVGANAINDSGAAWFAETICSENKPGAAPVLLNLDRNRITPRGLEFLYKALLISAAKHRPTALLFRHNLISMKTLTKFEQHFAALNVGLSVTST